jgi:hypothetical protein
MKLSDTQLAAYERDGFIVLQSLFSAKEVQEMKSELKRIQQIDTDHLVREKTGGVAKTIYKVHEQGSPTASEVFHAATRAPRLLEPAKQLLEDLELYVYHTKCNLKAAIDGSVWQWHQDYGTWGSSLFCVGGYLVYNQVKNRPVHVKDPRPDYVRSTNFEPLKLGSDEILGRLQIA